MYKSPTRITLLDQYSGSNLGDSAILDAAISQFRLRLSNVELTGISLNNDNMQERHGIPGLAVCRTDLPVYYMSENQPTEVSRTAEIVGNGDLTSSLGLIGRVKQHIKKVMPGGWALLKQSGFVVRSIPRELTHFAKAWSHLRSQDLLLVCGGGQLDDEWGGAWGHPYALFKWSLAARLANTPTAIVSVGVCRIKHRASRTLLGATLSLATYRSFREQQGREIAEGLCQAVADDPIEPDLAFAMPKILIPTAGIGVRNRAQDKKIIAISPIAFARPNCWPTESAAIYTRYVAVMASLLTELFERDYFLLFVWSSMGDDQMALTDIKRALGKREMTSLENRSATAQIRNWPDFVSAMLDADVLVASRLHSVILSYLAHKPAIAISFDPKVDWLMKYFNQEDCLLHIERFTCREIVDALDNLNDTEKSRIREISSIVTRACSRHNDQFDRLTNLARSRKTT